MLHSFVHQTSSKGSNKKLLSYYHAEVINDNNNDNNNNDNINNSNNDSNNNNSVVLLYHNCTHPFICYGTENIKALQKVTNLITSTSHMYHFIHPPVHPCTYPCLHTIDSRILGNIHLSMYAFFLLINHSLIRNLHRSYPILKPYFHAILPP